MEEEKQQEQQQEEEPANNENTTHQIVEATPQDVEAIVTQPFHSSEPLPLDWTQLATAKEDAIPLRYPHDVDENLNDTDEDICIVGTAGQKITVMGDDFSETVNPNLTSLVLRSHLIKQMRGLQNFTKLELLEFYDNMLEALDCLEGPGPSLRVLDMSYNVIRDMQPVSLCENLQELC